MKKLVLVAALIVGMMAMGPLAQAEEQWVVCILGTMTWRIT